MDIRERYPDDMASMLKAAMNGHQVKTWTALPGIVQSVDLVKHTVSVQPAIQAIQLTPDGKRVPTTMPLLPDVPIVWSRGGSYTTTFPISVGDEVLVVFSSRSIDNWWANGGVQPQYENRMHDLSDGFAIPGPFSQKTKIDNVSATTAQTRSNDGTLFTEIDAPNKKIRAVAGDVIVELDAANNNVNITASNQVNITSPLVTINGTLHVTGTITALSGTAGAVGVTTHRHGTGSAATGTVPPTANT